MLKPDIAISLICQMLGNSGKQCLNLGGGSPTLGRNLGSRYDRSSFEPGWSPGSPLKGDLVNRLCKSATVIFLIFMCANPNPNHPPFFCTIGDSQ